MSEQQSDVNVNEVKIDLKDFICTEILGNFPFSKKVFVKGYFTGKEGVAILLLEKEAFESDCTGIQNVCEPERAPNIFFQNDIYLSLRHFPLPKHSGIKTTVIYPATELLVKKYTPELNEIFDETSKLYAEVTLPFVESKKHSIEWVYNILDHKAEVDRIIFEDPDLETGFVLLPDLKWDGKNLNCLYVQALPHIRGIRSIRDLTAKHLPLLKKILASGRKAIVDKYSVNESQLLVYLHYLPSFYHLHVHFKLISLEGNAGTGIERAHLLSTVIQNLELCSDYYSKATLQISLRTSDELLTKLKQYGQQCLGGSTAASEDL